MPPLEPALIHTRSFRNDDPPRLAALWNRSLPEAGVVRPLGAHEFDTAVVGRLDFDRHGLIVAEEAGEVVGFTHAGFGPDQPEGLAHRLDPMLGTVAMLVIDPASVNPTVGTTLLAAAELYLKSRGAQVIYAGGQYPLDPFYRSIYGGSEWSGILAGHPRFQEIVESAGYGEVSRSELLELDLTQPEIRDPKAAILRRLVRLEVAEDVRPLGWWEALALGHGAIARYRLMAKADNSEVATASTSDLAAFGRLDGRVRVGLRGVAVADGCRRKGFGRHLITEIVRHLRGQWNDVVAVTTSQNNIPALALYQSVGFIPVGSASLYRKSGS